MRLNRMANWIHARRGFDCDAPAGSTREAPAAHCKSGVAPERRVAVTNGRNHDGLMRICCRHWYLDPAERAAPTVDRQKQPRLEHCELESVQIGAVALTERQSNNADTLPAESLVVAQFAALNTCGRTIRLAASVRALQTEHPRPERSVGQL
jgi:hypothetical protein